MAYENWKDWSISLPFIGVTLNMMNGPQIHVEHGQDRPKLPGSACSKTQSVTHAKLQQI